MSNQELLTFNFDPETNTMKQEPEGRYCLTVNAKETIAKAVGQSVNLANAINHMALAMNLIDAPTYDVLRLSQIVHVITETMAKNVIAAGVTLKPVKLDS